MKKTLKKDKKNDSKHHELGEKFHELGDELTQLLKKTKSKFDTADSKTKKGIVAGLAGAATLLAGAIGYKKMKGKK
jgi:hypothetical protein